jgi:hypothetical protein
MGNALAVGYVPCERLPFGILKSLFAMVNP